jgi:hypothetical protein
LEWATASENNSSHFVILTSSDGMSWRKMSQVSAAGKSNEKLIYSYTIPKLNEFNYVKLNQFDIDGKMEQFGPYFLDCDKLLDELIVYPNPAEEVVNIQIENKKFDAFGTLSLFSSTGQKLVSKDVPFVRGNNNYLIELEKELQGVYFIQFTVDRVVQRRKIVIL